MGCIVAPTLQFVMKPHDIFLCLRTIHYLRALYITTFLHCAGSIVDHLECNALVLPVNKIGGRITRDSLLIIRIKSGPVLPIPVIE